MRSTGHDDMKSKWGKRVRYRLRELMARKNPHSNYSIAQLAKDTGLSRRTLNLMANNELLEAPTYVLARLRDHFGLKSWDELMEYSTDTEDDDEDHYSLPSTSFVFAAA